jgi:hypothetical protein
MRPESTPNPADAGCNSELAQYSNTPSLRVAGFEDEDDDEDEDEDEAPHEQESGTALWSSAAQVNPRRTNLVPLSGHVFIKTTPRVETLG